MDGAALQDRIARSLGVAARRTGVPCDVFRPRGTTTPLDPHNRTMRLCASFSYAMGRNMVSARFGTAAWSAMYDYAYTRAGDYLVGEQGTYFVAAQTPLLPVMCIRANCMVSVARPAPVDDGGYSGLTDCNRIDVLVGWPASLLSSSAHISGDLPETRFGSWTGLLPVTAPQIRVGDVLTDDLMRVFVVAAAESTELGWRLRLREVAG